MAKLEVSDDQLKKFMDEATAAKVKELEKQVASLEKKLKSRDATIKELRGGEWREKRATKRLNEIADSLVEDGYTTDW